MKTCIDSYDCFDDEENSCNIQINPEGLWMKVDDVNKALDKISDCVGWDVRIHLIEENKNDNNKGL